MLCAGGAVHASRKSLHFVCLLKFRLGSAGEPNVCSHCYTAPYMKIPGNFHNDRSKECREHLNIKMLSYQLRDSHCMYNDKTV